MKDMKQGTEGTKEEGLGVSIGEGNHVPKDYGHLQDTYPTFHVVLSNTGLPWAEPTLAGLTSFQSGLACVIWPTDGSPCS